MAFSVRMSDLELCRPASHNNQWRAKPGCPAHLVAPLEHKVNSFPPEWLEPPKTGETFDTIAECEGRLRAYALAEGFDIVKRGGGTEKVPGTRFCCYHHGEKTRNWRGLEDEVQRDYQGNVTSRRQREATLFHQTGCNWSARVSQKVLGPRGSGVTTFLLTVLCDEHTGHRLTDNPLEYLSHQKSLDEYQIWKRKATEHRDAKVPYADSMRVLEAEVGMSFDPKHYYNLRRGQNGGNAGS